MRLSIPLQTAYICQSFSFFFFLVERMLVGRTKIPVNKAKNDVILLDMKLCPTYLISCVQLCDPMDCSSPGSSVHGILQAGIMEWVAIPFSRGSSQPRDRT